MPSISKPTALELIDVAKHFGGLHAVEDVNVGFESGQITCIIGQNGAGKTTLFNLVCGGMQPDGGEVLLHGRRLNGLPSHCIARMGVGRLFQDVRVFGKMTVLENVCAGHQGHPGERLAVSLCPWLYRSLERENVQRAREHLRFVGLQEEAGRLAQQLSYGQQKLVAIARLLNSDATCLLLDEPTAGVHPSMAVDLLRVIRELAAQDRTVVVIEHDLGIVREVGDWVYLMEHGRIEAFGTSEEVLRDSSLTRLMPLR